MISLTDPLGNITTTVFDAASRSIATVDPLGNRTSVGYDAANRPVTTTVREQDSRREIRDS
jgi:YD repeat-containing protein